MRGTIVGVLRGGPSQEHDVSLQSGHSILNNLSLDRFTPKDIFIDRQGTWHERGVPTTPERALRSVDVVIIGLHGEYGENGEVQKILERFGVPYTGSDSFASAVAMHKVLTKERAKEAGLMTPRYVYIQPGMDVRTIANEINRTFPQPVIVKPVAWGSSVGVTFAHGYAPIEKAINDLLVQASGGVLVEERIRGTEATAGVLESIRDEALYALPPVEIIPPEDVGFFAAHVKYTGDTREICPGRFSKQVTEELQQAARTMHDALGLRHYSRSDFIISPRGIYFLETNTLPGLTPESLYPKELSAIGISYGDFLSHLVDCALTK